MVGPLREVRRRRHWEQVSFGRLEEWGVLEALFEESETLPFKGKQPGDDRGEGGNAPTASATTTTPAERGGRDHERTAGKDDTHKLCVSYEFSTSVPDEIGNGRASKP